ncbi:hypothetical protein ALC53_01262 [Atta colombica]|uniref:Uncharacterized protein n=1 Tax=Atta colombica TaxID=520822 RepID=A0A195BUA7_9HYME|nr:hypothetical protein ALC53_01262 [Atta colombica]
MSRAWVCGSRGVMSRIASRGFCRPDAVTSSLSSLPYFVTLLSYWPEFCLCRCHDYLTIVSKKVVRTQKYKTRSFFFCNVSVKYGVTRFKVQEALAHFTKRLRRDHHTVNSERATNKRIFSIPALSKENTQRTFHLKPTLPISNFRQNEPLVFCHYPLEVVIFGSLQSLSSEVAASDFRDSSIQLPQVPKSKKDGEIRKTSIPKTKRAKEVGIYRLMMCCKVIVVVVVCETLSLRLSEFIRKFSLNQTVINAATTASVKTSLASSPSLSP